MRVAVGVPHGNNPAEDCSIFLLRSPIRRIRCSPEAPGLMPCRCAAHKGRAAMSPSMSRVAITPHRRGDSRDPLRRRVKSEIVPQSECGHVERCAKVHHERRHVYDSMAFLKAAFREIFWLIENTDPTESWKRCCWTIQNVIVKICGWSATSQCV